MRRSSLISALENKACRGGDGMKFSEWTDCARVERVARDARLQLDRAEAERLSLELGGLLTMLDKADCLCGQETVLNADLTDTALRADVVSACLSREELLRSAAKTDGAYFAVGRVMEDAHEN